MGAIVAAAEAAGSQPVDSTGRPPASSGRLLRNLGVLGGGQVLTWSVTLVWTLFIPRAVGPIGMGLLVLYWSAGGLMTTLAGMGTKTYLVREMAADPPSAGPLIGASFYLRGLSIVVAIIPAIVVATAFANRGTFSSSQELVLVLAFVATVVNLFTDPLQAAFQAFERMEYLAIGDVLVKAVGAAGSIVLIALGFDAVAIVVLTLMVGWMLLMGYFLVIRRHVRVRYSFDWRAVAELFRNSLTFWAFTISMTVYFWVDSILLAALAPPDQIGLYGAPTKLISTLMFVPTIIWAAWLPRLSSAHRRSRAEFVRAARPPLELSLILCLPIAAGSILISRPLITLLYGGRFAESIVVFAILGMTIVPVYLNMGISNILIASRRQGLWTVVMAVASVINPLLNLVLIPYFQRAFGAGAVGAAYALVITEVLIMAVGVYQVRTIISGSTQLRLAKTLAATALMSGVVALLARYGLAVQIGSGLIVFGGVALMLRLANEEELAVSIRILNRLRARTLAAASRLLEAAPPRR